MKLSAATIAPLLTLMVISVVPGGATAAPLVGGAWTGHQAPTVPAVLGTKEERTATAAAYYEQNRFVEAALGFEGLWRDYPNDPDFLFNAATSRFTAGHFAHAIALTDEYLAIQSIGATERQAAEAQRRSAIAQSGAARATVRLGAPPAGNTSVEIVAQFVPRDSGDIRPELVFKTRPLYPTTLQLDPGAWTIRAQASDHQAAEQRVEMSKGQLLPVTFDLAPVQSVDPHGTGRPQPPPEVPPVVRRRLSIGFGAAGGVIAAAGIGVVVVGSTQIGKARDCTEGLKPCAMDLSEGVRLRGVGFTVLGAGLGLIAGGIPWISQSADVRKKVWIAETAVGGALAAAGIAVLGATSPRFIDSVVAGDLDVKATGNVAGTMMLGLGIGTAISAITGLVVQRHYLRSGVTVGPSAGRGQLGLTMSGRF